MTDTTDLRKFLMTERHNIEAHGHCRIDYTDPVTGKVLERIEGDNHVFTDQLIAQDFQSTALASTLVITNGEKELDTDLPWLPGKPIGYGNIDSAATGVYRGAYRSTDSYRNRVTQEGITSLYVYDFLTTQITDTIRYVGLSAQSHTGVPTLPFQYRYPRDNVSGIYDIERKKLYYGFTCSLSNSAGGSGSLYFYELVNEPTKTATKRDVFELCDKPDIYYSSYYDCGYNATWGFDYENQTAALKLLRYRSNYVSYQVYTFDFTEDIWVFDKDVTSVLKHFQYKWTSAENSHSSWQYAYSDERTFWTGNYFASYFRLYGDIAFSMSRTPPVYGDSEYTNVFYTYQYDITSGTTSYEKHNTGHETTTGSTYIQSSTGVMYMYKGYLFSQAAYSSNVGYGLSSSTIVGVNPMLDVYTNEFYSYCAIPVQNTSSQLIEKGQTSIYGKTWNIKPYLGGDDYYAWPSSPFAFTAYQLPADAPVRPDNSAVTIAYGLTINW